MRVPSSEIPRTDPAAPLAQQVQESIDAVWRAYASALTALESTSATGFVAQGAIDGLWGLLESGTKAIADSVMGDDGRRAALSNHKRLKADIQRWADKGQAAVNAGKAPAYSGGWAGWTEVGNIWVKACRENGAMDATNLALVRETVREMPAAIVRQAKETAAAVERAGASIGWTLAKPIGIGLGLYLLARRFLP